MLGLMEPESLAPYGYEVPDSRGVKDRLDTSANSTTTTSSTTPINHIIQTIDRKVGGVTASLMFVLATGQAPLRAAASSEMETTTTTSTGSEKFENESNARQDLQSESQNIRRIGVTGAVTLE
eukprot:1333070-Amphidinium_carterae.1